MIFILSDGCRAQETKELRGTTWSWNLDECCNNFFYFINSKEYIYYNCDFGETNKGTYTISDNEIEMKEDVYTSNIPNQGQLVTNTYKMRLTSKGMTITYSKTFEKGKWKEEIINNPKVFFKKVN